MGAYPGERAPRARLTEAQVWLVRALYGTGRVSMATLGVLFGVNKSAIAKIIYRETWR